MAAFEPNLSIDVSRTTSKKVLRIFDTSFYTRPPENCLVEIAAPTSTKWVTFHIVPGFDLKTNASSLGLARVKSYGQLPDLPDGLYHIRQSIKPNFGSLTEFYHFRTLQLEDKWNKAVCDLYSKQCSFIKKEFEENKSTLMSIWMDIKACIIKAEVCHEKKEATELYEKAEEDLKNYNNECGCR